jgi:hypothetical protein
MLIDAVATCQASFFKFFDDSLINTGNFFEISYKIQSYNSTTEVHPWDLMWLKRLREPSASTITDRHMDLSSISRVRPTGNVRFRVCILGRILKGITSIRRTGLAPADLVAAHPGSYPSSIENWLNFEATVRAQLSVIVRQVSARSSTEGPARIAKQLRCSRARRA